MSQHLDGDDTSRYAKPCAVPPTRMDQDSVLARHGASSSSEEAITPAAIRQDRNHSAKGPVGGTAQCFTTASWDVAIGTTKESKTGTARDASGLPEGRINDSEDDDDFNEADILDLETVALCESVLVIAESRVPCGV